MKKLIEKSFDQSDRIDRMTMESEFNSMGLFIKLTITFYPNFINTYRESIITTEQFDTEEDLLALVKSKANEATDYYDKEYKHYVELKKQLQLF